MAPFRRRTVVLNIALVAVVVVALAAGAAAVVGGGPDEPEPTTATVERGTVIGTVAASGEVVSPGEATVHFSAAGTVVEVAVDVGEHVSAGQVIARLDDTPLSEQLEVAQANVTAAEAMRAQLKAGRTPEQRRLLELQRRDAALQVSQAEEAVADAAALRDAALDELDAQLDATAGTRDRTESLEAHAVRQAEDQVEQAEHALELAEDQHDAALEVLDQQVDAASDQRDRAEELRGLFPDDCAGDADCLQAEHRVDEARAARRAARRARDQGEAREAQTLAQADNQLAQARRTLELAEEQHDARLEELDDQIDAAERARDQGELREAQALTQAESQLARARLGLELAKAQVAADTAPPGEGDVAQADAQLTQALTQLAQVERDLDNAVLRAPSDGLVAAVNVQVGDLVAGAGAAGEPAIVLTGTDDREATALFSEADTTRLEVGQPAVVTFDARPDVSLNGRVRRIDVAPTVTGNLIQYGAYVAVEGLPDNVRLGQTTTIEVVVGQADDVLYVPSTAITTVGARTTVTVFDGETQEARDVEVGIQGDQHTQIVTGVDEGEAVVLPTRGAGGFPDFGPGTQEPSTEPASPADGGG